MCMLTSPIILWMHPPESAKIQVCSNIEHYIASLLCMITERRQPCLCVCAGVTMGREIPWETALQQKGVPQS